MEKNTKKTTKKENEIKSDFELGTKKTIEKKSTDTLAPKSTKPRKKAVDSPAELTPNNHVSEFIIVQLKVCQQIVGGTFLLAVGVAFAREIRASNRHSHVIGSESIGR